MAIKSYKNELVAVYAKVTLFIRTGFGHHALDLIMQPFWRLLYMYVIVIADFCARVQQDKER